MLASNKCRLCLNNCSDYKKLYDDPEVYRITVKYFDPMFLNLKHELRVICLDCWCNIVDFYCFQQSVLQTEFKSVEIGENIDVMVVKTVKLDPEDFLPEERHNMYTTHEEILDDYNDIKDESDSHSPIDLLSDSDTSSVPENNNNNMNQELCDPPENKSAKKRKRNSTNKAASSVEKGHQIDSDKAEGILKCRLCNKRCPSFILLKQHFQVEHHDQEFYIICCKRKFVRRYVFKEHLSLHYDVNAFSCNLCGKCHTNKRSLEEHISVHKDPEIFKCDICGKCHKTKRNLKSHMEYWHSDGDNSKGLTCRKCGKVVKTAGALHKHEYNHIKCRKKTPWLEHKPTHGANNPYACPKCPRTFKSRRALSVHLKKGHERKQKS